MGFRQPDSGEDWRVKGADAHVWMEIKFAATGWVPLDVTPPEEQKLTDETTTTLKDPEPQVLQPPPPADEAQELIPEAANDESDEDNSRLRFDWLAVLTWVGIIGLPLLVLVLPPMLIVWAKSRRHRNRRQAVDPRTAVVGGWSEVLDDAQDLRISIPGSATRTQVASILHQRISEPVDQLSTVTDRVVFGRHRPSRAEVESFWTQVQRIRHRMRQSVGLPARIRAAFSTVSLRKRGFLGKGE
jgi:hypothetical protein